MRTPSGNTIGHVYVRYPGVGFRQTPIRGGETLEGLELLRQEVARTDPGSTELLSGLDEVLSEPSLHRSVIEKMKGQGKFLLGITNPYTYKHADTVEPGGYYSGLLYAKGSDYGLLNAEASDDLLDETSFSVVRLGTWISRARATSESRYREELLNSALFDVGMDSLSFGVPVNKFTKIINMNPSADEPESYTYGQRSDEKAIRDLGLPEALTSTFLAALDGWYNPNN